MEQQISNDDIEGFKVLVHEWLSIDDKIKCFYIDSDFQHIKEVIRIIKTYTSIDILNSKFTDEYKEHLKHRENNKNFE